MPTRGSWSTRRSCLRHNRPREDLPRQLVGGRPRRRLRRAGRQLLRRDGDDHPRLAGHRRRRAGHPADPGAGRRAGDPGPRPPRQAVPGADDPGAAPGCSSPGRAGWRGGRGGRRRSCSPSSPCVGGDRGLGRSAGPARSTSCRSASGFATWLVCLSLLTEPLRRQRAALGRGEPARADGRAGRAGGRTGRPHPPHVPAPRRTDRRRRHRRRHASAASSAAAAGTSRRHGACCGCRASTGPRAAGRRAGSGLDGVTPWATSADDFYRIDTAFVVPTIDPTDWQLRIHGMVDREVVADLPGAARPPAHRGLGDAQLRVQPGRRRPDRQRVVERRPDRRPARRGRRPARRRRRAADLRRRLDLRHADRRAHRRPQRDARGRDERPAAAHRARLPGAHDRARALRLRLGVQVGGRDGGDPVRRHRGLLDRARLVRARAR